MTKGRILRDILRTLGHEWVHEYQMSVLGRKRGPDIGGKNENEANSLSAQFIKMFEKNFFQPPTYQKTDDGPGQHGQKQVVPRAGECIRQICAKHVKTTVRKIDHAHDAKYQRQPGRE